MSGSVRGYGAAGKPAGPGPGEQAPRVSKVGQRVSLGRAMMGANEG